jgi:hypothetical protein
MKTNTLALLALSAIISVAACGSDDAAKKDAGKDGPKTDTGADTAKLDVAPEDVAKQDMATDLPVDMATPDTAKLDTAPDTAADAGVDATPDASADVVRLDAAPDVSTDVAADTVPVLVDAGDGGGDAVGDVGPDAALTPCTPVSATCAPQLGLQIDRLGRAGVNTALTDPFWDDAVQTLADHKIKQDTYNQASNPATWGDVELATGKKT